MRTIKYAFDTALLAVIVLTATTAPSVAQAQGVPDAKPAMGALGTLEEVVVTARRRSENLQNVPLAVTAVTASELQVANVKTLEDLTAFAPNIKVNAGRATNSTINAYIRGVGQNDPLWGFEPGVGIYLDDVYMARPQAALLDVYDVERIEVLRGPQGTLYGKNTVAGAIKYVTRDIVGPTTVTVSATGGNYSEQDLKISASIPVSQHVYIGAAAAYLKRDGYGHVIDDGTPHVYNSVGQDVSDKDVLAARGNVTVIWGVDSKLRLVADTVQDNSNAAGGQRLNNFISPALSGRFDTRTDMPVDKERFLNSGYSATYTQTVASDYGLKLVGAYREGQGRQFIDFEELNNNVFQVPGSYRDHQGSGEAQLNWSGDRVTAVGGLYYFNGTACGAFDASLGASNLTSLTKGCVKTESQAVYADTTWKLTGRANLNAGLRWNRDEKTGTVFVAQYLGKLPANQTLFDPASVPSTFTLLAVQTNYTNKRNFSNVSPRLGVDMHFSDAVMGYVSYSRGFKSGGFDMRGNATANPATKDGYDSETADNFEVGVKSMLLGDKLQLNAAVFYTPYKDVQITTQQFQIVGGNPTNVTAVLNLGKQINKGVELESVYRPIAPLTLTLNVGYLDSYFEDFLLGCTPPSVGCTFNATALNKPINAPRWTTSLAGQYQWQLASGSLLAHLGYQYRSFTKVANTTVSVTDQPAYTILDAGLAYTTASKAWRFSVDGKNLTDKAYRVAGYDFGNVGVGALGGVSQIGFYGPPRTYAATVSFHF